MLLYQLFSMIRAPLLSTVVLIIIASFESNCTIVSL